MLRLEETSALDGSRFVKRKSSNKKICASFNNVLQSNNLLKRITETVFLLIQIGISVPLDLEHLIAKLRTDLRNKISKVGRSSCFVSGKLYKRSLSQLLIVNRDECSSRHAEFLRRYFQS